MIAAWIVPLLLALGLAGACWDLFRGTRTALVVRAVAAVALVALGALLSPQAWVVTTLCLLAFLAAETSELKGRP